MLYGIYFKTKKQFKKSCSVDFTDYQIGKGGISDAMVETVSKALDKRELVKLSVLDNAEDTAQSFSLLLAEKTGADVVCVIGRKIVLYRRSTKPGVEHMVF